MRRLLLFWLCLIPISLAEKKLEFVQAIWRHGDRAPHGLPYPNDPYRESYWPRGFNELTSLGMQQMTDLGKFFRQRYDGFISKQFSPSQVYMRSSDTDRTIVSADSFFFGMYPATGTDQWQSGNPWQPLPVHSRAVEDDWLCKGTVQSCPKFEEIYKKQKESDKKYYMEHYADFYAFLSDKKTTGNTNFKYEDVDGIYDITREMANNLTKLQPDWVSMKWPSHHNKTTLEIGKELKTIRYLARYGHQDLASYFGGYLLNDFIQHALAVRAGKQKNPDRMLWYSSHDTVISSLMYTMGLGNGEMPPYTACFFMEVYSDNGHHIAEFYYKNGTHVHQLTIPGCSQPCAVSELPEIYKSVATPTIEAAKQKCGTK